MPWPKGKKRGPRKKPTDAVSATAAKVAEKEGVPQTSALETLKLEAERQADSLGYDLGGWHDEPGWSWIQCRTSGRRASVALHPPPGRPRVVVEGSRE